jgi:hypothetical protein
VVLIVAVSNVCNNITQRLASYDCRSLLEEEVSGGTFGLLVTACN